MEVSWTEVSWNRRSNHHISALVARSCELESLLRIFDFVENDRPKDRCQKLYWLINRAFSRHWIPHDALRRWKKTQRVPLKTVLHEIREARNGVHANLFEKGLATAQTVKNVTFVVHAMYSFLEVKVPQFNKTPASTGGNYDAEYRKWMNGKSIAR